MLKFSNLGLALSMAFKLYINMTKRLKQKMKKFWALIPTFAEVIEEKLGDERFLATPILNRVNKKITKTCHSGYIGFWGQALKHLRERLH